MSWERQEFGKPFNARIKRQDTLNMVDQIGKTPKIATVSSVPQFIKLFEKTFNEVYPNEIRSWRMDDSNIGDGQHDIETPYVIFDYNESPAKCPTQIGTRSYVQPRPIMMERLIVNRNNEMLEDRYGMPIQSVMYLKIVCASKKKMYELADKILTVFWFFTRMLARSGALHYRWLHNAKPTRVDNVGMSGSSNTRLYHLTMTFWLMFERQYYISRSTIKSIEAKLIELSEEDISSLYKQTKTIEEIRGERVASGDYIETSTDTGPYTTNYCQTDS